jgi:hypothetical protein
MQHIEKNTFFSRQRFGKKEEEMLNNDGFCINCQSKIINPD